MYGKLFWTAILLVLSTGQLAVADSAKELTRDFKKAIQAQDETRALSLIDSMVALPAEEAFEALFDIGFSESSGSPAVFEKLIGAFARVDGAAGMARARYDKAKDKPDFRERVFLADILARCAETQGEEARAGLAAMLEDKSDHVQSAAVTALQKSMHRDAVEPLIKAFETLAKAKRRDAIYYEVRDALLALTGQEFELIEDWWKWWEPNRDSFDPKKTDTGGKTGVIRRKRKGDADFIGVPIASKNVVFVIDKSASMRYVMRDDIKGLGRGDGSDSGPVAGPTERPTPETERMAEFWSRWGTAKRNLKRVVSRVQPGTNYNIVAFSSDAQTFQKKALPASAGNNKKAFGWIDSLKTSGETFTQKALEQAFNADPRTTHIYFLSDGIPSKDGKTPDPTGPILDRVKEMNRYRKIKIYTFGYDDLTYPSRHPQSGLAGANQFLKELAESSGGTFTLVKVDPRIGPDNPEPPDEGTEE